MCDDGGVSCLWWGSREDTHIQSESVKEGPLLLKKVGIGYLFLLETKKKILITVSVTS